MTDRRVSPARTVSCGLASATSAVAGGGALVLLSLALWSSAELGRAVFVASPAGLRSESFNITTSTTGAPAPRIGVWPRPSPARTAWHAPLGDLARTRAEPAVTALPAAATLASAVRLYDHFTRMGYTLDGVRERQGAVPRIVIDRLPTDLPTLPSADFRKTVFIKLLLPLLLVENEAIRADRARLSELKDRLDQGGTLPQPEQAWLAALALRYDGVAADLADLLARVDIIPPSLALAQAALETGWGTSRAAQRAHAMFGQMLFRDERDTTGVVRPFERPQDAVAAYAQNLNTHRAYAGFRARRAELRSRGSAPDGLILAEEILRYSERKRDYIRDVRGIIRANNLRPLDHANLSG